MSSTRFDVLKVVKIQIEVLWFVTPCSVVKGYQRFGGRRFHHLHYEDGGSMDL